MSSTFTDQTRPASDTTSPKPRGLLPVPPEVANHVEQEAARAQREHGFALTEKARRRMLHEGALDWFYRDQWVSYRETPQGIEVLAVGLEEVGELASRLSAEERAGVKSKLV
ncbi:MAG: hypothetical protein L0Z62_32495 [Gemmataceae bacterium]|nr:hypothetical protein [Gemmataceae bacterium]